MKNRHIIEQHPQEEKWILMDGEIYPKQWDFRPGKEHSVFPIKSQKAVIKILKKLVKEGAVREIEPYFWEYIINTPSN